MAQTPNVISVLVNRRLKETETPPTPENYERLYYELSGLTPPEKAPAESAPPAAEICGELIQALREMAQEISDTTENLAKNLDEKNKDLAGNVGILKTSRDKEEILRLLSNVIMQAAGIQTTVEASHQELIDSKQALVSIQNDLAETRQLLNEDALTGALNRRGLDQTLTREVARCQRNNSKLCLAMVDLDYFKRVNDEFGHEAGDQLLVHFTSLMRSIMRKSDALVRYGGEEFTLILPETDARGATLVLGRLQQLMKKTPLIFEGTPINITFSAGIANLNKDENGHAMLRRADAALYQAKQAGRDKIVSAG